MSFASVFGKAANTPNVHEKSAENRVPGGFELGRFKLRGLPGETSIHEPGRLSHRSSGLQRLAWATDVQPVGSIQLRQPSLSFRQSQVRRQIFAARERAVVQLRW